MTKKLVFHLMLQRSALVVNVDGLAVAQIQINHILLSQEIKAFYSNIKRALQKSCYFVGEVGVEVGWLVASS